MARRKVFLSGPFTSCPDFLRVFADAEKALQDAGYAVYNPTKLPQSLDWGAAMLRCLTALYQSDFMVELPGRDASKGATMEHLFAQGSFIPIHSLEAALENAPSRAT